MDPVTQGALGAAASVALLGRRSPVSAPALAAMGWLGGMAADLDVLIRSSSDPLLAIEYHRHFTHSLAFVPLGGLIVALPWLLRKKPLHETQGPQMHENVLMFPSSSLPHGAEMQIPKKPRAPLSTTGGSCHRTALMSYYTITIPQHTVHVSFWGAPR